ncbi:Kinase non-catalytic C-lobe domain-containing protein 1 [Saguinus oedipus]|uniref:Kinase non-catalytic C-lobe domain-containing protein 1 n=1 Tax=Saguinus oedipus TaxID=9490 RepID=A0ABQ9URA3_SAGOE|nr:Kinase non-catalytic C-lobe domain-containing protein 1 [Saguinus oedipus]
MDSDELSRGNFEVGFWPQRSIKAERVQQPEADEDRRSSGGALDVEAEARQARSKAGSPAVSPGPAGLQSCSPGWCSAFYEADCFGADVHSYVKDLGRQQADGALPDAHSPALGAHDQAASSHVSRGAGAASICHERKQKRLPHKPTLGLVAAA